MRWWNPIPLGGQTRAVRLAQLRLWLRADPGELVVAALRERSPAELEPEGQVVFDDAELPADAEVRRFVTSGRATAVSLRPRLVERSVVARPRIPVGLPAGERVAIFVTTPLNVEVTVDDRVLEERSIWDPPETWFGPSPVQGELCYASRTRGSRHLEELGTVPTRAVTRIVLVNKGKDTLQVERIRLPVPRLTLAWDPSRNILVTETLELRREEGDTAEVSIEALPKGTERLAPPRERSQPVWRHALAALWS